MSDFSQRIDDLTPEQRELLELLVEEQGLNLSQFAGGAPRTPEEKTLAAIWAEVLRVEQVGIHDNFFELGGDSILSIQVIARANQSGLKLTPNDIFKCQTIAELATVANQSGPALPQQDLVTGPAPLTPIQHWLFSQDVVDIHHYNQSVLLEAKQDLLAPALDKAVSMLVSHHDALRLRFRPSPSGWTQSVPPPDSFSPFCCIDLSDCPAHLRIQALESAASSLQASLDLGNGPLLRVALFHLGQHSLPRLLITIHNLVVDGVSWRIILEDLTTAYEQARRGEQMRLGAKTTSYKQWAEKLREYAISQQIRQERAYWMRQAGGRQRSYSRQEEEEREANRTSNTVGSAETVSVKLSEEETRRLLKEVPGAYRTEINDVLMSAMVRAYSKWRGEEEVVIDMEGHGREEVVEGVELTRTVGWFTTIYPVMIEVRAGERKEETVRRVKERLREVPRRGIGYGIVKYLSEDQEAVEIMRSLPQADLSFNYLGQFDQVLPESLNFRIARDPIGPPHSPRAIRPYLIDINGIVVEGRLQMGWTYSRNVNRREEIEQLAEGFMQELRSIIDSSSSAVDESLTPSDFPLAKLNQKALNKLFKQIDKIDHSHE